jgi:beta-phosphoglucomutase
MKLFNFKVRAIIFDMDGVITNTMPYHFRAWKNVLKDRGISATYLDIYSREGQRGLQSLEEIGHKYQKTFSHQDALRMLQEKEELFKRIVRTRFVPGARRFIKRMHQRNFHMAIVTGTSRDELHRILPDDVYKLFMFAVTGNEVVNGKPHPEPYLKALAALKVSIKESIVIENAPLGIRSAKAAGLRSLALETSLPKKYLKEADQVFQNWDELVRRVNFEAWT